jgi:hypothetical protein
MGPKFCNGFNEETEFRAKRSVMVTLLRGILTNGFVRNGPTVRENFLRAFFWESRPGGSDRKKDLYAPDDSGEEKYKLRSWTGLNFILFAFQFSLQFTHLLYHIKRL